MGKVIMYILIGITMAKMTGCEFQAQQHTSFIDERIIKAAHDRQLVRYGDLDWEIVDMSR